MKRRYKFKKRFDGARFKNLDASESVFFARELEHIKARTYDVKFPELKARKLFPPSFEAGQGAEAITYRQFTQVGMAKIIANYSDDLPMADISGEEFTAKVKSLGAAYGYSLQEIRAAAMAGRPLKQGKANAARRAIMAKENSIAFNGDTTHNLPGFLSNANVNTVVLPADGSGSSKAFSTKTDEQILRDLNSMATTVHAVTKGVEAPDTLLLPITQFNLLFTKRVTDTEVSVGKWFLQNSPHIKSIEWVNELDGAGSGGADLMVAYARNPEKLTLEIPSDFEQLPVQVKNLGFKVPCHERICGVLIYYPLSVAKAEGL